MPENWSNRKLESTSPFSVSSSWTHGPCSHDRSHQIQAKYSFLKPCVLFVIWKIWKQRWWQAVSIWRPCRLNLSALEGCENKSRQQGAHSLNMHRGLKNLIDRWKECCRYPSDYWQCCSWDSQGWKWQIFFPNRSFSQCLQDRRYEDFQSGCTCPSVCSHNRTVSSPKDLHFHNLMSCFRDVCINADGRKHLAKVDYVNGCAKLYFQGKFRD